jgi:hypothetical protein
MASAKIATFLGNFTPSAESFAGVTRSVSALITPPDVNAPYFRVVIKVIANGTSTSQARFGLKVILTPNSSSTMTVAQVWNGNNTTYTFDGLNQRSGYNEWISPTTQATIGLSQVLPLEQDYVVPNFCGEPFYIVVLLTYESAAGGNINHRVEVTPISSL